MVKFKKYWFLDPYEDRELALGLYLMVLLMDEAFSALDPLIRNDMQGILLDLQKE